LGAESFLGFLMNHLADLSQVTEPPGAGLRGQEQKVLRVCLTSLKRPVGIALMTEKAAEAF